MIRNVVIKDNTRLPYQYAKDLPAFANGKEYKFKDGVNVIVGKNGCGKSTFFKTLKAYLMVAHDECGAKDGEFSRTVDRLRSKWQTLDAEDIFLDGVSLYFSKFSKSNIFRALLCVLVYHIFSYFATECFY